MEKHLFEEVSWQVFSCGNQNGALQSTATIKGLLGNREVMDAEEGEGPVDALNKALLKVLRGVYPVADQIILVDYMTHIENDNRGTAARVKVIVELQYGQETYLAKGISANILEASWSALVDGYSKLLS